MKKRILHRLFTVNFAKLVRQNSGFCIVVWPFSPQCSISIFQKAKDFVISSVEQKRALRRKGLRISEKFKVKTLAKSCSQNKLKHFSRNHICRSSFGLQLQIFDLQVAEKTHTQLLPGNLAEIFLGRYSVERLSAAASVNIFFYENLFIRLYSSISLHTVYQ